MTDEETIKEHYGINYSIWSVLPEVQDMNAVAFPNAKFIVYGGGWEHEAAGQRNVA